MRIRIASSLVFALLAALAAPAQSALVLGTMPNASTAVGGALVVDLTATTPVTLTQLDFWTGAGTLPSSSVSVSIYLNAGGIGGAVTPGMSVLIGSTVPVVTTAAGPQSIAGAIVVPAAPFAAVTFPAGAPFGLTLVANNCSLSATMGWFGNSTADLQVAGGIALSVFPFAGPGATLTNNRVFTGVLRYTVGGTPINLQENVAYGTSCFGLSLVATGVPTPGGTMVLTTSNPTNIGLGLCILSTDGLGWYPNGVDLAFLGAPGCRVHADLSAGVTMLISNLPAPLPGMSVLLPLPAGSLLLGVPVYSQSVWMDPTLNAFGIATSNGVRIRIG
ncbi:MAG TPA: hypothetical protein VFD82_03120 [Planctomycetota bacterium]|nr:hypothetical protein [Planctomycetota bacterium]